MLTSVLEGRMSKLYAIARLPFNADVRISSCSVFIFRGTLSEQARVHFDMCECLRTQVPNRVAIVFIGQSHYDGLAQTTLSYLGYESVEDTNKQLVTA